VSYYDCFADQSATRVGRWIQRTARRRQLAAMQPFLPATDCAVLEIGPGTGELLQAFRLLGYRNYTVVEPNAKFREHLAATGVATRSYMIPHLEEEDSSFDVIVLFHVFEHLETTRDARMFISEARRVLRSGGLLCILSPDYLHLRQDFFNVDYTHSNITTLRRTLQLFHDNGFGLLKHAYFSAFFSGCMATLISHMVRLALWFSVGNRIDSRLYKLKTTFLRSFLVVGAKQR
jgi:SAM-dependent methyltransferase